MTPKTFPVWAEHPSPAVIEGFVKQVAARPRVPQQPLQDNRCPICLGDIYTCECGKARR